MGMHGKRPRWFYRCPSAQKILSICYPSQGESQVVEQHPLVLNTAEIPLDLVLLLLSCLDLLTMVILVKKNFKQGEPGLLSHFYKLFILINLRNKQCLFVPQVIHLVRKLKECFHISLRILKGLSNFGKVFLISKNFYGQGKYFSLCINMKCRSRAGIPMII